jgi:dTMP kinase
MSLEKLMGKFIALDGPDGCGKSTQVKLLADWLAKKGVDVVSYREPGATAIGEKIRQILLNPEHIAMTTAAEVMLYMAARVQLWNEKISPALKENKCVVVDRWLSSTCAYQGNAGGFGTDKVIKIATDCLERPPAGIRPGHRGTPRTAPWPDLTIILDVDLKTAATRLKRNLDRMEQKGDNYNQKVREGFLKLAKQRKDFSVVNASMDIQTVHQHIIDTVQKASFDRARKTSCMWHKKLAGRKFPDTITLLRQDRNRRSPKRK